MQIHELSAVDLKKHLEAKKISSREIVDALIARREAVDGEIRAFVLTFDAAARKRADEADAARARGESWGLLHGLPVTIKENIDVAGTDSTMGLKNRQSQPAKSDAVTVKLLKDAGAIVIGKTNVPQLLLAQEAENEIWGITHNPWNTARSPGGSSGGEAAALASGTSVLGIGTDIGGSIRIPAHFCGIHGLKPTVDRWSNRGSATGIAGQEMVRSQMGPMARHARDLALLMQAVDLQKAAQLDPAVPPWLIPDLASVDLRGMRVGVTLDDGYLTPNVAIQRAVKLAADALKSAGATIVDYQPPGPDLLFTWLAGISSDGGTTLRNMLAGEMPARQLQPSVKAALLPGPIRALLAAFYDGRGEKRMARLLRSLGQKPVADLWALTNQRTLLRRAEIDAWSAQQLDLVLCPPHTMPAMPIGTSGDLTMTLSYAFRYVMLNFPAGVAPVTRVLEGETVRANPADLVERRCAAAELHADGMPVGVQVVAPPYREERVLAAMAAIEDVVSRDVLYPRTPIEPLGKGK
jgi:fatty acid amide hydrolase